MIWGYGRKIIVEIGIRVLQYSQSLVVSEVFRNNATAWGSTSEPLLLIFVFGLDRGRTFSRLRQQPMHLIRLHLLLLCVVLELLEVLCDITKVLTTCIDLTENRTSYIVHLAYVVPHTEQGLDLVDHLVASAHDMTHPLDFLHVYLGEAAALCKDVSNSFVHGLLFFLLLTLPIIFHASCGTTTVLAHYRIFVVTIDKLD